MHAEDFRDGIFALNTRRFGSVAEILIQNLRNLGEAKSQFHDLYDDMQHKRVEVKFSRAFKKSDTKVTPDTVLECIESAKNENRTIKWKDRERVPYLCNIQQIKKEEFDVLYYGIFFSDLIAIFHINSEDIGQHICYSDRQHKGNSGEGQFCITDRRIDRHVENHFYQAINYNRLFSILSQQGN